LNYINPDLKEQW